MMKKGEKNQGGLKVHDFFHGGYSKMYFKPAEESFFSGEGEWQVIGAGPMPAKSIYKSTVSVSLYRMVGYRML